MIQIPKRSISLPKYFDSFWSPEYQKLVIDSEAAKHDWNLIVHPNEAFVIAANFHKFHLQFDASLQHVSCSCQKFIDDELNWCQHLSILKHGIQQNWKILKKISHEKKPNLVFYNSETKDYFYPVKRKYLSSKEVIKLNLPTADSIANIIPTIEPIGIKPNVLNPFSNIRLYSYQEKAIEHMLQYKRTILSLEMGWGKTLCALICSKNLLNLNPDLKILIVCPKSLKSQWEKEIQKYFSVSIQNIKNAKENLRKDTFTILNYEMARTYPLQDYYDVVILDEVQKIKNKNTLAWKGISKIKSEWCWALSGTVVENNVEDFLAITDILRPELFRVRWKFYHEFCDIQHKFIRGFKNSEKMNEILKSILYRAPNEDCPFSVNVKQMIQKVKMTANQKKLHDNYYQEVKRLLAISMQRPLSFSEKLRLSAYQTKTRMAADSECLLNLGSQDLGKKISTILEIIKNEKGKIVLFSEWKEFLNLVEKELQKNQINFVRFDGSLSQKQRKQALDKFIQDPTVQVFSSTDSGGTGVDGLQFVSDVMIHAQMPWNPARLEQREGRLVRIGQKNDVKTYLLLSENSIEESMVLTHERKKLVKNAILESN